MSAAPPPLLTHGEGSLVRTSDGAELVDLAMGFGSAFLGHAHPAVAASVQAQLAGLWNSGRNPTPVEARVARLVTALLPAGMRLGGLCSTGMEAAEFAMRVAATSTGRRGFAGFARSMHGKSALTAALCWSNAALRPDNLHTLPFPDDAADEDSLLARLDALLATRDIAAVLVEPIQGSNAAHGGSVEFHDRVVASCREHGALCVLDEILTGLYRTGTRFYAERLSVPPDMILFAKSMGNGFPVSALAIGSRATIGPAALPGSTFSGNPLALAAIEGTLTAMAGLDMEARVAAIGAVVQDALAPAVAAGAKLRGRGALWCLELAPGSDLDGALHSIRAAGVLVTSAGNSIRLLPAATIETHLLARACGEIARACIDATRR